MRRANPAGGPPSSAAGEDRLRAALNELADQLCSAVDGDFDFSVRATVEDETVEKLAMLTNFVVDSARRGMAALRDHNAALAELDRAKTTFFNNISHEFRTPLTLILGPVEDALAQLGSLSGERLASVHRNALRLLKLVNSLLDFSRIEAGRLRAVYQPTDLGTLTSDLAAVFRAAIERAGLAFKVDCPAMSEPVYVDREMWEKIIFNLLSNALKFTFAGEIAVSLRANDGRVELEVRDTGRGIPEQELPRLFERFHRIESTVGRTHEGSGIGLALVQELARLHGGTATVASAVGRGSTFVVSIPRGTAHLPAERFGAEEVPAGSSAVPFVEEALGWTPVAAAPSTATARFDSQGVDRERILVADDNADMRAYVGRLLGEHWRVETVADGAAALEAARRNPPQLVLSDVMMPGLDGYQLIQALRADARTGRIPVVLLSARAGEEARVEGLELGADDYLVKPFSGRELVARVRIHLELARLRIESERARAEAESANRAKDEFLAMLGHELRNPLAPIRTALHLMERRGNAATAREREILNRQVAHLVRLVDDLLDISRITRGGFELENERVEMSQVVAQAVETASPLLEQRRQRLELVVSQAGLGVNGDRLRLSQVVSNLVTNAAKFSDPGGKISVSVERAGQEVVLRVRDTGIGISAEMLPQVFDMFRQERQSLDRSQGGLGLGLAIVRNLVKLHGGRVEARSEGRGRGSEFVVRLPLAAEQGGASIPTESRKRTVKPPPEPRRVLIVDDNVDAAQTLADVISDLGHVTQMAHDGPSALEAAKAFSPQIALLDIGLPLMDGFELARAFRATPVLSATRLVAITGYSQPADRQRSQSAGFDAHLVKPVRLDELTALIEELTLAR